MEVTRQDTDISNEIATVNAIQGILQLAFPFIGFAVIMIMIFLKQNLNIILHSNDYKASYLKIDSVSCSGAHSSASSSEKCSGYGKVEGIVTIIDLGWDFDVDFGKEIYPVFYRDDGNFTLIRKESDIVFNNTPYLKKASMQLGLPLIIISVMIMYYRSLTKKLRKYEKKDD